ncbi:2-hydroxyhepta-2,4-diene-1,7-dioate isomerase [Polycladomyces abyssicola]|uniref:2-hydroxyhepta-2,4-diene-1,7-dioate isomerase n=1 Tax=Polycladomyces abyssicola TaxID=1125966 RepID=A0A8D5UI56_9BACL|nr:fumarylacetoacetate hydrolase family protein [Polycladomyces abyssicola]BCU82300.1 2-hydroxyhepta-2,4-diene-1,7-dioate isomerase [Polycladomyces abyssicola]
MKIARYLYQKQIRYGIVRGNVIHPISGSLYETWEEAGEPVVAGDVQLLAPLIPNKLIGIGLNYAAHAEETGKPIPDEPMMFMISPTAVIGPEASIVLPNVDDRIDHEAELAVVIGKRGKNIPAERAADYILGYTCANDVSNRVLQKKDGQFTRAKSFDSFKPLGPVIETELDPSDLEVVCRVNGDVRQKGRTSDLIHSVPELIAHISSVFPLEPGDVILTGTPSGVGPLSPGDQVEVEVEGIGVLTNRVLGPLDDMAL